MAFFKTNTATDAAVTEKDDLFVKIKKGESVRVRVLPAMNEKGQTVFKQVVHFKLKDPDADGDKGIMLGCNRAHGNGPCAICDVHDVLKGSDDPNEVKLTKFPDSIGPQTGYYIPVLVATKNGNKYEYSDPKLLKVPMSGAQALANCNSTLQTNDLPLINDEQAGQDVIVANPQNGFEYKVTPTSVQVPLSKIKPDIEDKLMPDVPKLLDTKLWSYEKQVETLKHSLKNLDVDAVLAEVSK